MTHSELVQRAKKWLLSTKKCGFVLSELASWGGEIPDAIGWKCWESFLVECKASRADFVADRKKLCRSIPQNGMGDFRYFMCVPGVIASDEQLPEKWGLLWVFPRRVKVVRKAELFDPEKSARRERPILFSALRRVHLRGDLEKIYRSDLVK